MHLRGGMGTLLLLFRDERSCFSCGLQGQGCKGRLCYCSSGFRVSALHSASNAIPVGGEQRLGDTFLHPGKGGKCRFTIQPWLPWGRQCSAFWLYQYQYHSCASASVVVCVCMCVWCLETVEWLFSKIFFILLGYHFTEPLSSARRLCWSD